VRRYSLKITNVERSAPLRKADRTARTLSAGGDGRTGRIELEGNEVSEMKGSAGRPTAGGGGRSGAVRTDQVVRLSVNLNPQVADEIKGYADRKGISITEAVRRAISVLAFVDGAQSRGASLNVEEGGSLKEVLFLV
jgi:hypothetical protein